MKKYFFEGKRFRDVRLEDQFHPRFIIRRIKGDSRPQMVVQIEELNFEKKKIVLQILSFMDMDGSDFRVLDKGEKSLRFILDL